MMTDVLNHVLEVDVDMQDVPDEAENAPASTNIQICICTL